LLSPNSRHNPTIPGFSDIMKQAYQPDGTKSIVEQALRPGWAAETSKQMMQERTNPSFAASPSFLLFWVRVWP
jgi:hypothetical protein